MVFWYSIYHPGKTKMHCLLLNSADLVGLHNERWPLNHQEIMCFPLAVKKDTVFINFLSKILVSLEWYINNTKVSIMFLIIILLKNVLTCMSDIKAFIWHFNILFLSFLSQMPHFRMNIQVNVKWTHNSSPDFLFS